MVLVRHMAHLSFDAFFFLSLLRPCELDCTKDCFGPQAHGSLLSRVGVEAAFPCSIYLFFIYLFIYFYNSVVAAAFRMLGFSFSYSQAYLQK